jgi:hypothetical protein
MIDDMRCSRSYGVADDQEKQRAGSGDVVDIKNDEWRWHGSPQDHPMTRLSLAEGDTQAGDHVTARSTGAIE